MPAETQQELIARSGGNPLYAEQFVRMQAERGDAAEVALPDTVQGIIGARIDGLSAAEKDLIQNAAVMERVAHDLSEIENALTNGDGDRARFHLGIVGNVLTEYRAQQGNTTKDGADVTAILLMLNQVSPVVDAGFQLK